MRLVLAIAALVLLAASGGGAIAWSSVSSRAAAFELTLTFKTPPGSRVTRVTGTHVTLEELRGAALTTQTSCELSLLQWRELRAMTIALEDATTLEHAPRDAPTFMLSVHEDERSIVNGGALGAEVLAPIDTFVVGHASACLQQNLTPVKGVRIE